MLKEYIKRNLELVNENIKLFSKIDFLYNEIRIMKKEALAYEAEIGILKRQNEKLKRLALHLDNQRNNKNILPFECNSRTVYVNVDIRA
jgi:hypothetical protein